MLNNLAVADAEHVEHIESHVVAGRWDADELTLMVPENVFSVATRSPSAICSFISTEKSGKASQMYLKNSRPSSLFPDSPGTRRAIDEVIRRKFLSDLEPVTALELLDETANDALVLFLGHGSHLPRSAMAA